MAGEVLRLQLHRHQGCGVLSEGTHSLFTAKRMTIVTVTAHPTFATHTKVQAFKPSVVVTVLVDEKFKLCNGELAIQGKV